MSSSSSSWSKLKDTPKLCWLHKRQFHSVTTASTIFIAGGMKFAWCIFEEPPVTRTTARVYKQLLMISWFIGALLAFVLSSIAFKKIRKNIIYCFSAALLMSSGVLTFIYPAHVTTLFCGNLIQGCAYGLTLVQFLATVSEEVDKHLRGLLIASERIALWSGICVQLLYTRFWYAHALAATTSHTLHVNQLHGLIIACLGFVATLLTMLQRLNVTMQPTQPKANAAKLMSRQHVVEYGNEELQQPLQHKQARNQSSLSSGKVQIVTNYWQSIEQRHIKLRPLPLFLIFVLRGFVALSMSLPFNRAFLTSSWSGFACDANCLYLLAAFGLLGSIVGSLLVDIQGRRRLAVISMLLGGIIIFIVGGIFDHAQNSDSIIMDRVDFEIAARLQLVFQFFTCLGVGVVSSAYLAEAVNGRSVKSLSIAAILTFEHFLQIGLTLMVLRWDYSSGNMFFGVGMLSFVFGLLVFFCMPETKLLSADECWMKFYYAF